MNQIYFVLQQALGRVAKKQAGSFTESGRTGHSKNSNYFTALLAVMLFSGIGASYAQTNYYSNAAATDFNDVNSWGTATDGTGAAPAAISNADNFFVANNAALTLSADATVRQLTITTGSLTVAANTLTIGIASQKNSFLLINGGTLTVSGGTVNIDGYLRSNAGSTFNQSAGAINIDPNNGGVTTGSTTSTQYTLELRAAVNWTGGTITLVDPPATNSSSHYSVYYNVSTSSEVSTDHTLVFGDGVSTDASGGTSGGFYVYNWIASGKLNFGNWVINGPAAGNRKVKQTSYPNGIKNDLTIMPNAELDQNAFGLIVGGDILVNTGGIWTANAIVTLALASGNGSVVNPETQTISGGGTIRNSATTTTGNFTSLTVNNSSTAGIVLDRAVAVTGTLTLTSGVVHSTDTNLLSLGTATAAGTMTGGSATAYINGPFERTIATNNAATNYMLFPVGKAEYAPIWVAPVTTSVSTMRAEVFDSNAGTASASIASLANRRWEAPLLTGTATSVNVRLGNTAYIADNLVVMAPSADGEYTDSFGTTSVFTTGTPNTIQGLTPTTAYTGFISQASRPVCLGVPAPGATIASSNAICLGASANLSVANATVGSGVTYQWESSANNTDWTAIDGATNATYTVTPTAVLYYRLKVTCATGPDSETSTPVQVTFSTPAPTVAPGLRCGPGQVTLTATGAAGATNLWYDAATGGTLVNTGDTFQTPALTANTNYYVASTLPAAGNATIGTGTLTTTTDGVTPFNSNYESTRVQYLIRASELKAAGLMGGNLTSLTFTVSSTGAYGQKQYTVKMGHATENALTAFSTATLSTVYGPIDILPPAVGANTIAFDAPFTWDGETNVVVEICHVNDTAASCNCYGANSGVRYTTTTFNSVYGRYRDDATNCGLNLGTATTTVTSRPNMTFGGQIACSSLRVPVAVTVGTAPDFSISDNTVTICGGQTSSVVTITEGDSDFDTYTWAPAAGVTGNAATGWSFNPSVSTTYTLTASQSTGALCTATATVAVTVNTSPTALTITNSSTASTCVGAVATLSTSGGLVPGQAIVGTDITLNASSTTNTGYPAPYGAFYENSRQQYLIRASELTALGLSAGSIINNVAFDVTTLNASGVHKEYTISIGNTAQTAIATWETGLTTVFGPVDYQPVSGANTHAFATGFTWNGTSNIVIQVCHTNDATNAGNIYSANALSKYTTTTFNSSLVNRADNASVCGSSTILYTQMKRPNMVFGVQKAQGVVWSPDTNLYTDATASTPYVAGTPAATVYVKPSSVGSQVYTAKVTTAQNCSVESTVTVTSVDCSIGWANLQWPANGSINTCGTHTVYAQVYKSGVTEPAGQGANIQAWIGVNTSNTDPSTWDESSWHLATFNATANPADIGNNDEYLYNITGLAAGTYYYASRFRYLEGPNWYGGFSGGAWNGTTIVNGELTVNAIALPTAADQSVCSGATVANLVATATAPKWYTVATNGTALAATDAVTAGNYFVSQTIDGCESARVQVAVTITTFDAPVGTVTQPTCTVATGTITVASLGTGYTYSINGTDFQPELEFAAVASGTYTLTAKNATGCTMTSSVVVNAQPIAPVVAPVADFAVCGSYTLPALTVGNYFTATNGGGTALAAGDEISSTQTIYVFAESGGCSDEESFVITVNSSPVLTAVADVTTCGNYTLPVLTTGNYFTATNGGGTALAAGDEISSTQTIYVYAQSGTTPNCTAEVSFVVTVTTAPVVAPIADVTACDNYTLPALAVGNYYTLSGGTGTMMNAGEIITSSQTLYVYAGSTGCSDEESFVITINQSPVLATVADVVACGNYTLPVLTVGKYYTQTGGTGTEMPAGTVITASQTIYVYAESATSPNCTVEASFAVTITTAPAQPTGAATQAVTVADAADATIEDLVATAATGTISWYATEANALSGTDPLPAGTLLVDGEIYYATAAIGTCRSTTALAVTVSVVLGKDDFSFINMKYYPNPVTEKLTITHSNAITSVEVYNLLGQMVISERPGISTVEVNMGQLQQATYIVRISAEGKSKDFKVVKK